MIDILGLLEKVYSDARPCIFCQGSETISDIDGAIHILHYKDCRLIEAIEAIKTGRIIVIDIKVNTYSEIRL